MAIYHLFPYTDIYNLLQVELNNTRDHLCQDWTIYANKNGIDDQRQLLQWTCTLAHTQTCTHRHTQTKTHTHTHTQTLTLHTHTHARTHTHTITWIWIHVHIAWLQYGQSNIVQPYVHIDYPHMAINKSSNDTVVIWLKRPSNKINNTFELVWKMQSNNLRFYVSKHVYNTTYTELKIIGLKRPFTKISALTVFW